MGVTLDQAQKAGSIVGDVGNMLGIGQKRQMRQSKELMDIQSKNQMKLNVQGQELAMKSWKETNYPAQVAMLKEAGLNPGLLYGGSGSGGSTTASSGSGGSAASAQAPQARTMNLANTLETMAMQAAIENQKASARKSNAEAGVIEKYGSGKSEAEIEATKAGAGKAGAETENVKVNTAIAEIERANTQREIDARVNNTMALTNKLVQDNAITAETRTSIVKRTAEEAVGAYLDNVLTEAKTKMTETERQAITTGIVQKWTELSLSGQKVNIEKFNAEIKAEYPNAWEVAGSILKKAYDTLEKIDQWRKGVPQDRVK